ncbi:hypothetical protein AB0L12_10815 [Streptomyces cellulosae]
MTRPRRSTPVSATAYQTPQPGRPGSPISLPRSGPAAVSSSTVDARPEDAGDLDAEGLAGVLVDDVRRSAHRSDDVAVPVLRTR